jgi:hypothetical protein
MIAVIVSEILRDIGRCLNLLVMAFLVNQKVCDFLIYISVIRDCVLVRLAQSNFTKVGLIDQTGVSRQEAARNA